MFDKLTSPVPTVLKRPAGSVMQAPSRRGRPGTVDDETVQDQVQRDAKSVAIVTGFLLGAAVLVLGLLLVWLADELIGVPQHVNSSLTLAIEVTAVVVLVAYVARNRRL
jgi:hypothetical protein